MQSVTPQDDRTGPSMNRPDQLHPTATNSASDNSSGSSLAAMSSLAAGHESGHPAQAAAQASADVKTSSSAQLIRSAVAQRTESGGLAEQSQEQLANLLTATIILKNWSFSFRDQPVGADEVAGPRGMLPALLWQVEKMHRVAYGGISTGIQYAPDAANQTLGAAVVLPQNGPRSPMALFAIEALQRMQDTFPGPDGALVDSMVREFFDDHDEGLIPWAPGSDAKPSLSALRQSA